MLKRIRIAWRLSKLVQDLEFWNGALPRLEALKDQFPRTTDQIEAFIPKLTALESVLGRLDGLDSRLPHTEVLEALNRKLGALDSVVGRIETLSNPVTVNIAPAPTVVRKVIPETEKEAIERRNEWNRLKMLAKFCQLEGKAKEIEQEWQRIQQDEHDAHFAFQTLNRGDSELVYLYKKGIVDGIKWCIERFT